MRHLYILKNCLTNPKWLHLLGSCPNFNSSSLNSVDLSQRRTTSELFNIQLSDASWSQASLPVHWGGGGHVEVSSVIVTSIIQPVALASFDTSFSTAIAHLSSKCCLPPTSESLRSI